MKRLRENYRILKAVMSNHLHMSHGLDNKKARCKDDSCQAKAFRHQVKNGLLSTQEMEEKRQIVFSLDVDAMNDLERWTGKGSRLLAR